MPVLVLRLAGPLQSWGISSKYERRSSGTEPSKSGVIGMIAAAMGISREDPLDELGSLRFGVRKDQVGRIVSDFHMAHIPSGAENKKASFVTRRQYISDSIFLVALEGEADKLERIGSALSSPRYPLFLGRRSCPPSGKLCLGIKDGDLEEILDGYDWQASHWYRKKMPPKVKLEIVCDSDHGTEVNDKPVSFSLDHRQFERRTVVHRFIEIDNPQSKNVPAITDHDAMSALRGERCSCHVSR